MDEEKIGKNNCKNKQRSSDLPKIERTIGSSSTKELRDNSSKQKSGRSSRPCSSTGALLNFSQSKISVSELLVKTVEKVQSISTSFKDIQPSLLASILEERSIVVDSNSIALSQSVRSRCMETDSLANFSFESARLSSRTPRAMLTMINSRVQHNRDPPSFVSQFHDLPPSSLSWDERPTLKRLEASNPPVNVIGCNHSLDLILAKADWRARQIQKVNEIRAEKAEQRVKDLQEEIVFKQGRAARHAAAMELQQKQIAWMKFVSLLRFIENAKEQYESKKTIILKMQHNSLCLLRIRRFLRYWYRYRLYHRYSRHFQFRSVLNLRILIRIGRKVRSTNIIKRFVREHRYSGNRFFFVVKRFNAAVLQIQRFTRQYLEIKRAQLFAAEQLWLNLEVAHLRRLMEKRKEHFALMAKQKKKEDCMAIQSAKWFKCDEKMEAAIGRLRAKKILHHRTEAEELHRLLLPTAIRHYHMDHLIFHLRKDFYKGIKQTPVVVIEKERAKDKRGFNELDALDMLCGRNVDRIYSTISGISMDELAEKHGGPNVFSAAVAKNSSSSSSSSSEIVTSHARTAKSKALLRRTMIKSAPAPFRLFRTFSQPEQRAKIMNLIKELHEKQLLSDASENNSVS